MVDHAKDVGCMDTLGTLHGCNTENVIKIINGIYGHSLLSSCQQSQQNQTGTEKNRKIH